MYTEDDLIPISALQHLAFCERQCALIHIEQQWAENRLTVEGEERFVDKDDVVFIPPHTRHALSAAGLDTLCLVEIFAPAGNDFVPVEDPEHLESPS